MKIELKNVTYNARLSEETAAFAATVYVDGKKRGEAKNDGHGGMTFIYPQALHDEIDAYAKTLPTVEAYGEHLQPDGDMVIGDILADYLTRKDLKRQLAKKTLFVREGKLYSMKMKGLRPKDAGAVVLNDLPLDEAVVIYVKLAEMSA
jgi:hypothetical protein